MGTRVETSELVNPTGLKGPGDSVLQLNKEISCFAGYEGQDPCRDEKKILCVFLTVKEPRFWPGPGVGAGGIAQRSV